MDLHLRGKAAAVMAGSEGLGRASALALAREGASVAICARDEAKLSAAAKGIAADSGARVVPLVADVALAADVRRFVDEAARELGGLDALVVNAGGPPPGRFEELGDEAWQKAFDLTLMSAVRAVRASLPHFRGRGGGSVVAISSSSIKQPIDNLLLSNSIRLGVAGLFKSLAAQYAAEHIRFNTVLPGSMDTQRARQLNAAKARESGRPEEAVWSERAGAVPMKRAGDAQELGDVVAFLASDAARYVTGQVIAVDGGLVRYPL